MKPRIYFLPDGSRRRIPSLARDVPEIIRQLGALAFATEDTAETVAATLYGHRLPPRPACTCQTGDHYDRPPNRLPECQAGDHRSVSARIVAAWG